MQSKCAAELSGIILCWASSVTDWRVAFCLSASSHAQGTRTLETPQFAGADRTFDPLCSKRTLLARCSTFCLRQVPRFQIFISLAALANVFGHKYFLHFAFFFQYCLILYFVLEKNGLIF